MAPSTRSVPAEPFDEFLVRRERASVDYINGSADALLGLSTAADPATFFPPGGERIAGAKAVNAANLKGAGAFVSGSTGRFEVLQSGSSGDVAFWAGVQHAEVRMAGKADPVKMVLRVTEIFRVEEGEWKLVHRHADMPTSKH